MGRLARSQEGGAGGKGEPSHRLTVTLEVRGNQPEGLLECMSSAMISGISFPQLRYLHPSTKY